MAKSVKELIKQTQDKMKPVMSELNRVEGASELGQILFPDKYKLVIGNGKFMIKTEDKTGFCFGSRKIMDENSQVVVLFEKYEIRKSNKYIDKKIPIPMKDSDPKLQNILFHMKDYWEEYIKTRKINGLVFVYNDDFTEDWVHFFQDKFPLGNEEGTYDSIFTGRGYSLMYKSYSDAFKKRVDNYEAAKIVLKEVFEKEKLLSFYETKLSYLYDFLIRIEYVGVQLAVGLSNKYGEFEIEQEDLENEKLPFDSETIITYFEQIKENQKLSNLLNNPRKNYLTVLSLIGLGDSYDMKVNERIAELRESQYGYLSNFGEWEFIEIEMGSILKTIQNMNPFNPNRNFLDAVSSRRYLLYHFQTANYHYDFIVEVANGQYTQDVDDFKIFCSTEEENTEATNYFIERLMNPPLKSN